MTADPHRAGRYVKQPTGYRAYIPAALPPTPALEFDGELIRLLSGAADALGRLDGVTQTIPNPDLFVAMYVRREAVLSSQIKGTQSTLDDVLEFELDPRRPGLPEDVEEVVNYVRAMNHGLSRMAELPLSLRLLREIHAELLHGGRGREKQPGEFRRSQNWIGAGGAGLSEASFIPPPPHAMNESLGDLERFLYADHRLPPLVECGLVHAQFETIHPFLEGNGRVGRLLITFLLVHRRVLHRPLLYLSYHFKRHRAEYYDRLTAVREMGDWESWLRFFFRGVEWTASEATQTAREILSLRGTHRLAVSEVLGLNGTRALDALFARPVVNVGALAQELSVTFVTANRIVEGLQEFGILEEVTGGKRNRVFRYTPYLALFTEPVEEVEPQVPVEATEAKRAGPRDSDAK